MGFTNLMGGGDPAAGGATPAPAEGVLSGDAAAKKPDFGQRLGNYFENRFPIAGGLSSAVFGNNAAPQTQAPTAVDAPLPQMPGQPAPDYSMLAMNAKPQEGGGLAAILKLIGV